MVNYRARFKNIVKKQREIDCLGYDEKDELERLEKAQEKRVKKLLVLLGFPDGFPMEGQRLLGDCVGRDNDLYHWILGDGNWC